MCKRHAERGSAELARVLIEHFHPGINARLKDGC
jgi:hypothetical protein